MTRPTPGQFICGGAVVASAGFFLGYCVWLAYRGPTSGLEDLGAFLGVWVVACAAFWLLIAGGVMFVRGIRGEW